MIKFFWSQTFVCLRSISIRFQSVISVRKYILQGSSEMPCTVIKTTLDYGIRILVPPSQVEELFVSKKIHLDTLKIIFGIPDSRTNLVRSHIKTSNWSLNLGFFCDSVRWQLFIRHPHLSSGISTIVMERVEFSSLLLQIKMY